MKFRVVLELTAEIDDRRPLGEASPVQYLEGAIEKSRVDQMNWEKGIPMAFYGYGWWSYGVRVAEISPLPVTDLK